MQRAYSLLVRGAREAKGDPGALMGTVLSRVLQKVEEESKGEAGEEAAPVLGL